ncbi:uncharacterized protein LOC124457320 [Xenia sp. Carnegie-2017]|uniref:uncharacterized protein LOC124457320 n=1 Tax=Xenia sp. Carnegie-2017 TaxID=2897299 RepID=UPI001F0446DF|nr:uncharacterized protein LOC124457320 [Xenia sp. Carnegie-2017]
MNENSKVIKNKRKRPYRQKIKCSACNKEMFNDNFSKHNNSTHKGKGKIINIVDPSQKRLSFASCNKSTTSLESSSTSLNEINETAVVVYEEKNKEELESCAVSENPFTIEDNTSGTHEIAEFEAMVDDNINEEVELCVAIEEPLGSFSKNK